MNLTDWNAEGREKNARVCQVFEDIIERGAGADESLDDDARSPALADAVLSEVVALNDAGRWREAHDRFDAAHLPFVPHMDRTAQGLTAVVMLGPDAFLVRRGDWDEDGPVLHIDGDAVGPLGGVSGFAVSRDRRWLALAMPEGVVVSEGLDGPRALEVAWPEGAAIRPRSLDVSVDGRSVVVANDDAGVWLARDGRWTKLVPREGVGDDDDDAPDVVHAAISPDGRYVAYGWQDAPGHYVESIGGGGTLERVGVIGTVSDYPYRVLFTDDSARVLSNTRHLEGGVTTCPTVESLRGTEPYDDLPDGTPRTDEYLRAYGLCLLPGELFGRGEPVAWIGGKGWSHAAPLRGGKPVFTHLFGSGLHGFDYDPVSKRAAVASASGVLHVMDPGSRSDPGRARGYKPRRELYRWIFWDTLPVPVRW
jgi:hypothetical protein